MNDTLSAKLRVWAEKASVDRAIGYAVLTRVWQLLAGPVTSLLIAFYFQPEQQGAYYLFLTLVGIQTIAELGFHSVLVHLIAHAAADMRVDTNGEVVGSETSKEHVGQLLQAAKRWFTAVTVLSSIGVFLLGLWMLHQKQIGVQAVTPWSCLVLVSAATFALTPYMALLEGCGQMRVVNGYRVLQAVLGNLIVWTAILANAGLWVVVLSASLQLACECIIVFGRYKALWPLLRATHDRTTWREKIWPLQWRVGLLSASHWFAFSLHVLLTWHYAGPVAGGQMGMTWTILLGFQTMAVAWIRYRFAEFGQLISRGELDTLDRQFQRIQTTSMIVLACLLSTFLVALITINSIDSWFTNQLASRLLPIGPAVWLSTAVFAFHLPHCWRTYVRLYRQEPFLRVTLPANLSLAASFAFGFAFGNLNTACVAFASAVVLIVVPSSRWVFRWMRVAVRRDQLSSQV